jgi:uncharacterized protein YqeY
MTEEDLRLAVKEAMRARDTARTRVLRNVLAAVKNQQIEKRSALTAAEGVAVIQREARRAESVAEQEEVLAILESLLPRQMDEAELQAAIAGIIAGGAGNIGEVMKELTARHAGTYDGKTASRLVREALAAP